jgi:threonine dehydrogenase-like Zn-dependent dehydrogenase
MIEEEWLMNKVSDQVVAVIGLGYVGLPLAVNFARKYTTIGFDMNEQKVARLAKHSDTTGEVSKEEFDEAAHLTVTSDAAKLRKADFIIVAVPTPIDEAKQPDLSPLESASAATGKNMKRGAVVVFESTVYPGTTEEVCVPIMEKDSGFKWTIIRRSGSTRETSSTRSGRFSRSYPATMIRLLKRWPDCTNQLLMPAYFVPAQSRRLRLPRLLKTPRGISTFP